MNTRGPRPLRDLEKDECRFPLDDLPPGSLMSELEMCGRPAIPGKSYCPTHDRRAHGGDE